MANRVGRSALLLSADDKGPPKEDGADPHLANYRCLRGVVQKTSSFAHALVHVVVLCVCGPERMLPQNPRRWVAPGRRYVQPGPLQNFPGGEHTHQGRGDTNAERHTNTRQSPTDRAHGVGRTAWGSTYSCPPCRCSAEQRLQRQELRRSSGSLTPSHQRPKGIGQHNRGSHPCCGRHGARSPG